MTMTPIRPIVERLHLSVLIMAEAKKVADALCNEDVDGNAAELARLARRAESHFLSFDIENGGCDVCNEPSCYRNQPDADWPGSEDVDRSVVGTIEMSVEAGDECC
jgi:hypothetical protein